MFQNNEEVRIIPIYRDPVHDFGYFKFNPAVREAVNVDFCIDYSRSDIN